MRIDQKENERKNFRRRGAAVPAALPLTLQSAKNGSSSSKLSKYSLAFQGLSSFLSITSRGAVTPPRSPLSFQISHPPTPEKSLNSNDKIKIHGANGRVVVARYFVGLVKAE